MNNGLNNPKKVGLWLLQQTQILSQNNAISTGDRIAIASYIKEGMATRNFEKLQDKLIEVLDRTTLPEIVEEMIISI